MSPDKVEKSEDDYGRPVSRIPKTLKWGCGCLLVILVGIVTLAVIGHYVITPEEREKLKRDREAAKQERSRQAQVAVSSPAPAVPVAAVQDAGKKYLAMEVDFRDLSKEYKYTLDREILLTPALNPEDFKGLKAERTPVGSTFSVIERGYRNNTLWYKIELFTPDKRCCIGWVNSSALGYNLKAEKK